MLGLGEIYGDEPGGSRHFGKQVWTLRAQAVPAVCRRDPRPGNLRARRKAPACKRQIGEAGRLGFGVERRAGSIGLNVDSAFGDHVGVQVHLVGVGADRLDGLGEDHLAAVDLLTQLGGQ